MPKVRNHTAWTVNGTYDSCNNLTHFQHPKKQTRTMKIWMNGKETKITAELDPHSFYTILNVYPGEDLLGEDIKIARKNGEIKENGRVVTGTIFIDSQEKETTGQIIYINTFPKTIIGWKQLHDLNLMQADTNRGFVIDVPPVLITGSRDPDRFHQPKLKKHLLEDARRVIASWVRKGLIERCNSDCNAPISLATKRNGKVKIIFNFDDLNECLVSDLPNPHRPRAIEAITLGKYYSVFTLFYGEWQIPLDTYTKYKTAFTFLGKQYVWNRLPGKFKYTNHRLNDALEKVLIQLPENMRTRVTYYIDTILISAETEEECDEFTDTLRRHLVDNSFEIRQTVCQMCEPKVQFLGREVTENGVRLGEDFIQKVKNMKSPRDKNHLRSILSCLNDALQYTPGFSIFSKSLFELTGKNSESHWDDESEAALNLLKNQVLRNRFVVPGLAEKEACTVQIFVKDRFWMAEIFNSANKPYRYASGVFPPLKKEDSFAIKELKAMKEVWNKYTSVLESRDVKWEVTSREIEHYKNNLNFIPKRHQHKLDFLKTQGCEIKVVPSKNHKPSILWP